MPWNLQEEANAPAGGRRKSGGGRAADPHFIGYTYKNWDAVHPPPGARSGDHSHIVLRILSFESSQTGGIISM